MFDPARLDKEAVKLWYDEVLLARTQVLATLDELRTRSGNLLAVVAVTTAFLATLTSTAHEPTSTRPLEITALALFGVVVVRLGVVISPSWTWATFARPGRLRRLVTGVPPQSAHEVRITVARRVPKDIHEDQTKLRRLQWIVSFALVVFAAEIICWALGIL